MAIFHYEFSILFQIFSDEGEERIPESCTDDSIDDELGQIHFSHSRRQRDKMPHNWDESADQYRDMSSLLEKMFRGIQFFLIQQKIFSEFSDERFASIISYSIRYQRSDDTSECADDNDSPKAELLRRYQKSCKRHDGLARHWQNHALHHHSDEDGDISGLMDEGSDIGREEFRDSHTKILNKLKDVPPLLEGGAEGGGFCYM